MMQKTHVNDLSLGLSQFAREASEIEILPSNHQMLTTEYTGGV